uniref:Putative secreted protein n=1 Tax=Anopheles darlingi TaxID=43151 RepID=A0A2M4DQT0_ANODA
MLPLLLLLLLLLLFLPALFLLFLLFLLLFRSFVWPFVDAPPTTFAMGWLLELPIEPQEWCPVEVVVPGR